MERKRNSIECNGCSKCNSCNCFHKVMQLEVEEGGAILDVSSNSEVKDGDKFCLVLPCKATPPEEDISCTIRVGEDSYELKGIKSNELQRRKLYRAKVLGDTIKLLF